MTSPSKIVLIALCAVAAAVGAALLVFGPAAPQGVPQIAGFVYPEPRAVSPFELVAHNESAFGLDALKGKWSFAFFGYTHCPDVCPTTTAELSRVQQLLQQAGVDQDNQYLLVSVDPKRDTPKRLGDYVTYFNEKFIGVTGEPKQLQQLAQEIGVAYGFPQGTRDDHYPVDHSSVIALFDPDARLHAVFTSPHRAKEVADGFRKILGRWRELSSHRDRARAMLSFGPDRRFWIELDGPRFATFD